VTTTTEGMHDMSDPHQLVSSAYEAFARGDIPAVLDTLDPAVAWRVPDVLPHGGAFDGVDGVGTFFSGLGDHWADLDVRPDSPIANGERVAVTGIASGHLRATGESASYGFAHVWTFRDGRATAFDEYVDPAGLGG